MGWSDRESQRCRFVGISVVGLDTHYVFQQATGWNFSVDPNSTESFLAPGYNVDDYDNWQVNDDRTRVKGHPRKWNVPNVGMPSDPVEFTIHIPDAEKIRKLEARLDTALEEVARMSAILKRHNIH